MREQKRRPDCGRDKDFCREVDADEKRKEKARREGMRQVWFGLGMIGLVGWSVALPPLLGVALGLWLDSRMGHGRFWTLALLCVGMVVGAANAWFWLRRESRHPDGTSQAKREK